jgi:REP element-mobilizing transposase RayT
MARKARAEVEGGLYHVITRGNNRRQIFNSPADYEKFLLLLAVLKIKLPFFLYAYCLMTNHVHLLLERQASAVGRIMHRLLTGYAQYYNRRYRRVGHLLQGRHKAILCQSERYLSELVRYIHLNPVRAGMVTRPEDYQYSSHRAYLGLEPAGVVDVDPVLRHFGASKEVARDRYRKFVEAGLKQGHCREFYAADEGRILGSEEFIDATIHRIGSSGKLAFASTSNGTAIAALLQGDNASQQMPEAVDQRTYVNGLMPLFTSICFKLSRLLSRTWLIFIESITSLISATTSFLLRRYPRSAEASITRIRVSCSTSLFTDFILASTSGIASDPRSAISFAKLVSGGSTFMAHR